MDQDTLSKINEILDAPTMYPDKERKPREQREAELLDWHKRYREVFRTYNLYGLDVVDAPPLDDYLDRGIFGRGRYLLNSDYRPLPYPDERKYSYSYAVLMRDKLSHEMFFTWALGNQPHHIPCAGMLIGERWYELDPKTGVRLFNSRSFEEFIRSREGDRLVFKTAYGAGSHGVKVISIRGGKVEHGERSLSPAEFFGEIARPDMSWLVQEYLVQHPEMAKLNESSVNTMRIVTFNTGKRVVVAPQVTVRYGKEGSPVDNECYYSSVDSNGIIGERAYSLYLLSISKAHCAGWKIPFFEEALKLVKELHTILPGVFTIGWDIAITADGPAVIEANDGWDPFLNQTEPGNGMRAIWNEMKAERVAFQGYDPTEAEGLA